MGSGPFFEYDERKWAQPAGSDDESRVSSHEDLPHTANSVDEVLGEIGLVLVIVLGIVMAINLALTGLHVT